MSQPTASAPPTLGLDAMQNRGIETELGEPVLKQSWANQYLKKKSETPPDPLGEPVLKKIRNPSRPVGRTST